MIGRRGALETLLMLPALIRTPGLLMPIRPLTPVADWVEMQMALGRTVADVHLKLERPLHFKAGSNGTLLRCFLDHRGMGLDNASLSVIHEWQGSWRN